jgi:hypothetical protein
MRSLQENSKALVRTWILLLRLFFQVSFPCSLSSGSCSLSLLTALFEGEKKAYWNTE